MTKAIADEIVQEVKYRAGIFYSDEQVDKSVLSMINSCVQSLIISGVTEDKLSEPLAVDIFAMWVDAERSGSMDNFIKSAGFISKLTQLRLLEMEVE